MRLAELGPAEKDGQTQQQRRRCVLPMMKDMKIADVIELNKTAERLKGTCRACVEDPGNPRGTSPLGCDLSCIMGECARRKDPRGSHAYLLRQGSVGGETSHLQSATLEERKALPHCQ